MGALWYNVTICQSEYQYRKQEVSMLPGIGVADCSWEPGFTRHAILQSEKSSIVQHYLCSHEAGGPPFALSFLGVLLYITQHTSLSGLRLTPRICLSDSHSSAPPSMRGE